MLNADAIQAIVDLGHSGIEEIGSHQFHVSPKGATALKYPKSQSLTVFSLGQLVNFLIAQKFDAAAGVLINVLDYNRVQAILGTLDDNEEVSVLVEADFSKMYKSFPFETQLTQSEFIINLMTKFENDDVVKGLLKLVSEVRAGKLATSTDDGYSQEAIVKGGVHLSASEKIQNIWHLKTFKTFPEVEQPTIPYILRLHQREDEVPKFALYDCDGANWKVKLASVIREWCIQRLKTEGIADKVTVL